MSGLINKVKDALHHDKDSTTSGSHTTGTTGTSHGTTYGSTNAGPHDSNAANKLDPRVDSDLDGGRHLGANQTTTTHGHSTTGGIGGTHGSTNAGPHDSNLLNKADPRVDSDLDRSRNMGANQTTSTHGTSHGTSGLTGTTGTYGSSGIGGTHGSSGIGGTHGSSGIGGTHGSSNTTAGPHSSNLANKLDPRVDSDRDGSRNIGGSNTAGGTTGSGSAGTHTGTHAGTSGSGLTGGTTHGSGLTGGNTHGSSLTGGNTHGSGLTSGTTHGTTGTHGSSGIGGNTSSSTAGPHSSDMMNKIDPRVDSDLDGSKTYGGNKTHTGEEPLDAAKHKPSIFKDIQGDPQITHGDGTSDHASRHGGDRSYGHYGSGSH